MVLRKGYRKGTKNEPFGAQNTPPAVLDALVRNRDSRVTLGAAFVLSKLIPVFLPTVHTCYTTQRLLLSPRQNTQSHHTHTHTHTRLSYSSCRLDLLSLCYTSSITCPVSLLGEVVQAVCTEVLFQRWKEVLKLDLRHRCQDILR